MSRNHSIQQHSLTGRERLTVRLAAELEGHTWEFTGVCFSPDGKFLVTAAEDDPVLIWDMSTLAVVRALQGHPAPVSHLAVSPDGMLVAVSLSNGVVWIWSIDGEFVEELPTIVGQERVAGAVQAAFSPHGTPLATIDEQGSIRLWDIVPARLLQVIQCPLPESGNDLLSPTVQRCLAWSPDGSFLARECPSEVSDKIRVRGSPYHSGHPAVQVTIEDVIGPTSDIMYSPDGKYLAIAGGDLDRPHIQLWNVASRTISRMIRNTNDQVYRICFSPDGKYLAQAGDQGYAGVWDVASGRFVLRFAAHVEGWNPAAQYFPINAVAWSPDGKFLATAGWHITMHYRSGVKRAQRLRAQETADFRIKLWAISFSNDLDRG